MNDQEMELLALAYKEAKAQAQAKEDEAEALKAQMIAEMDRRKVDSCVVGVFKISWGLHTRTTLDGSRLKLELPETWMKFAKSSIVSRFSIT